MAIVGMARRTGLVPSRLTVLATEASLASKAAGGSGAFSVARDKTGEPVYTPIIEKNGGEPIETVDVITPRVEPIEPPPPLPKPPPPAEPEPEVVEPPKPPPIIEEKPVEPGDNSVVVTEYCPECERSMTEEIPINVQVQPGGGQPSVVVAPAASAPAQTSGLSPGMLAGIALAIAGLGVVLYFATRKG